MVTTKEAEVHKSQREFFWDRCIAGVSKLCFQYIFVISVPSLCALWFSFLVRVVLG